MFSESGLCSAGELARTRANLATLSSRHAIEGRCVGIAALERLVYGLRGLTRSLARRVHGDRERGPPTHTLRPLPLELEVPALHFLPPARRWDFSKRWEWNGAEKRGWRDLGRKLRKEGS